MVPAEEETRACDVSPGSSSLRSPEPAVLARCPRCPSCRTMRAAGACGAAKRATIYAWGKQPHTEPNPAPAGDSATSAEPSTRVARISADATAPARPECRRPSWTLRGHPRETTALPGLCRRACDSSSPARRCGLPCGRTMRHRHQQHHPGATTLCSLGCGRPVPQASRPAPVSVDPWSRVTAIRGGHRLRERDGPVPD